MGLVEGRGRGWGLARCPQSHGWPQSTGKKGGRDASRFVKTSGRRGWSRDLEWPSVFHTLRSTVVWRKNIK